MRIIILGILVLILLVIKIKINEKFLINDDKWLDYRLGDIIKGYFINTNNNKYLNNIVKTIPNSIGGKYITLTKNLAKKDKINNYTILKNIIKEKTIEFPNHNEIVFHIRLGDIISGFKNGDIVINKKNWGINLKQINNIFKSIKDKKKKIILIYGSHKKNINIKNNNLFLSKVYKILKENGFKFENKNSGNPDKDFVYMCNSKIFIKSGGGFSRIIADIVKMNGGKVIDPNDYIIENFENNIRKIKIIPKPNNWSSLGFNKKIKIYGVNLTAEHGFFADKYRVKKYINDLNISNLKVPKLIKLLNKNEDLDLNVSKNCVIKTNNGWNDIIIIKNNKIEKMIGRGKKMEPKRENYELWKKRSLVPQKKKYEDHYKFIKPEILCEEYLGDNLVDYKFYCIHGKVEFVLIMKGRFNKVCKFYLNRNLELNPFTTSKKICKDIKLDIKDKRKIKEMIDISENISSIFEFARIDLYLINNDIYFGEITLTPMACNVNINPTKYDLILGKKW